MTNREPRILSKEYHLYIGNSPYVAYVTTDYGLISDYIDRVKKDYPEDTLYKLQTIVHYAPQIEVGWVVKAKDVKRAKSRVQILQEGIDLLSSKNPPIEDRRELNRTLMAVQQDITSKIYTPKGW